MEQVINKKKAIFYSSFLLLILSIFIFSCSKESTSAINNDNDNISNNPDTGFGIIGGKMFAVNNDYYNFIHSGLSTGDGTESWSNAYVNDYPHYTNFFPYNNNIYTTIEGKNKLYTFNLSTGIATEVMTFGGRGANNINTSCFAGNVVYNSFYYSIMKYTLSSSDPLWIIPTSRVYTMLATNDFLYIVTLNQTDTVDNSAIIAYRAATGTEAWKVNIPSYIASNDLFYNNKKLFYSTKTISDIKLNCIDAQNGNALWSRTFPRDSIFPFYISIERNKLIAAEPGNNKIYALDKNTGNSLWTYISPDRISSPPTISNDAVYFTARDSSFNCLNATTSTLSWKSHFTQLYWNTFTFYTGPPVVADTGVFFSTTGKIYALNKNTGRKIWEKIIASSPPFFYPFAGSAIRVLSLRDYLYFPAGITVHK